MGRFIVGLLVAFVTSLGLVEDGPAYATHLTDPFGGANNRSLVLDNFDGGSSPTVRLAICFLGYWSGRHECNH